MIIEDNGSLNMADTLLVVDDVELNVSDDDFLKDTEIVREHHNKTTTCPKCGEVFEI
jgi:hypothetical protein